MAGDWAGERRAAAVSPMTWRALAQPGRGYVLWAMDYFLGKILHGLLLGLLHGLLHMGYYMLGYYMVGVPAADVRRRTGRDAWMGLAGSHAGLLSSVLLAPGGRFHPTGHDAGYCGGGSAGIAEGGGR